ALRALAGHALVPGARLSPARPSAPNVDERRALADGQRPDQSRHDARGLREVPPRARQAALDPSPVLAERPGEHRRGPSPEVAEDSGQMTCASGHLQRSNNSNGIESTGRFRGSGNVSARSDARRPAPRDLELQKDDRASLPSTSEGS